MSDAGIVEVPNARILPLWTRSGGAGGGVANPGGEHERAERVRADLDAGSAEVSVLHEGSPDVSMTWVGPSVDVRWHQAETLSVLYGITFRLATGGPWHPSRPGQ